MKIHSKLLVPLALCAAASFAPAQDVGTQLGEVVLEGYTQTEAESFEDYTGRTILIEFFAYW